MNILFLGNLSPSGSSFQRAAALGRLGHRVTPFDPLTAVPRSRLWNKVNQWTGFSLVAGRVTQWLSAQLANLSFDAVWVDGGVCLGPESLRVLRRHATLLINYNLDDPTGRRDGNLWATFKRAIPGYDLMVAVRSESAVEYGAFGARNVMQVYRGYDEVAHQTPPRDAKQEEQWRSEVVFVGTWMPERGPFVRELLLAGIPLTIYGDRWSRAKEWPLIRPHWRGPAIYQADYVHAVQYAKVALGLLSKGNRDLHTQRSAEIPFIGTAFCAEQSTDHTQLYRDGEQAMLWRDANECVVECRQLLNDEQLRHRVAAAGRRRVLEIGLGNESVLRRVLAHASDVITTAPEPREASAVRVLQHRSL